MCSDSLAHVSKGSEVREQMKMQSHRGTISMHDIRWY